MEEVCACEFLENARVRIDTALRDGEDAVAEDGWREEREEAAAADHQSIAGFSDAKPKLERCVGRMR